MSDNPFRGPGALPPFSYTIKTQPRIHDDFLTGATPQWVPFPRPMSDISPTIIIWCKDYSKRRNHHKFGYKISAIRHEKQYKALYYIQKALWKQTSYIIMSFGSKAPLRRKYKIFYKRKARSTSKHKKFFTFFHVVITRQRQILSLTQLFPILLIKKKVVSRSKWIRSSIISFKLQNLAIFKHQNAWKIPLIKNVTCYSWELSIFLSSSWFLCYKKVLSKFFFFF